LGKEVAEWQEAAVLDSDLIRKVYCSSQQLFHPGLFLLLGLHASLD
jgi:hypothetical protein